MNWVTVTLCCGGLIRHQREGQMQRQEWLLPADWHLDRDRVSSHQPQAESNFLQRLQLVLPAGGLRLALLRARFPGMCSSAFVSV